MKLEDQVVSLEIAKQLKELGVPQESLFQWYANPYHGNVGAKHLIKPFKKKGYDSKILVASAFTVAELGEMLPSQLINQQDLQHPIHQFVCEKQATQWHAVYICASCMRKLGSHIAQTEADARAEMLIYLIEHNLITI